MDVHTIRFFGGMLGVVVCICCICGAVLSALDKIVPDFLSQVALAGIAAMCALLVNTRPPHAAAGPPA